MKDYREEGKNTIAYEPVLINGYKKSWNAGNQLIDSTVFKDKKVVYDVSFRYHENGAVSEKKEHDYVKEKISTIIYMPSGNKTFEKNFEKDKGTAINYDENGKILTIDTLFEADERESSFAGGNEVWKKFLQTNLNGGIAAKNGAKPGEYSIVLQFIIEPDGTVSNVKPLSKLGYGMEEEGVRVISNSPKWIPARENGRYTRAYRKQYLSFIVYKETKK